MVRPWILPVLALALSGSGPADENPFETPFRVQADGEFIDTGTMAAPALVDVDGDGLQDLLVGRRAGQCNVLLFRNTGSRKAPAFGKQGLLQAGGKPACVPKGKG
jgi:hypothetical protein